MNVELTEQDIQELRSNSVAWREKQKTHRKKAIMDEQRRHAERLEEIEMEYHQKSDLALDFLYPPLTEQ